MLKKCLFYCFLFLLVNFSVLYSSGSIKIVYTATEFGRGDIKVMVLDKNLNVLEVKYLTDWPSHENRPCWSNDGKMIAFSSDYQDGREVWIMDADGNNKKRITSSGLIVTPTAWSLDGKYIYGSNSRAGDGEVAKIEVETGNITMLTNVPGYNTQRYDLSSTQKKIIFVRGREGNGWTNELYVADFVSDGNDFISIELLPDAVPAPHCPKFAPDDKRIAFFIAERSPLRHGIAVINTDGSGFWQPVPINTNCSGDPEWIDNDRIIYESKSGGAYNLYIVNLEDSSQIQLTNSLYENYEPNVFLEPLIKATVNIDPDTLNLQSKGKWITVYIALPVEYNVSDIDINTVRLIYNDNEILASWGDIQGGILMVKFDRAQLIATVAGTNGDVELKVAGKVGSLDFEGKDTIRVKE